MDKNELSGQIIKRLPIQEGTSSRGAWKKQTLVIETTDQYPKKVAIDFWNDKVDEVQKFFDGQNVTISINIESKESNERWYTEVKGWKIV